MVFNQWDQKQNLKIIKDFKALNNFNPSQEDVVDFWSSPDGQTEGDAYEPIVQVAYIGLRILAMYDAKIRPPLVHFA